MTTKLNKTSEQWLEQAKIQNANLDFELLAHALEFAESTIDKNKIPYAESSYQQGLAMATELLPLNCDSQTLAAAIIYPGVYHNKISKDSIIKKFGNDINKLIAGVQRMEAIHSISASAHYAEQQKQMDNLRKMLLAMVDDVRIVLIILAERLAILKYLKHCQPVQRQQMAKQTMHIYAPLANRLGIGQFKWQIEDLSFRYLNPDDYQEISKSLNMRRQDRDVFINKMIKQLTDLFKEANFDDINISGRAKHIFSIYRKLKRKGGDYSELYDTSAFRVLLPTIKDCYTALGIVHSMWPHVAKEFDDYIAKPKPNGYRSIHTVVVTPGDHNVEIQFRTFQMHEEAELGVAAHWKYKENTQKQSAYEEKINLLREVMDWQKEVSTEDQNSENLYKKIFADRIYVFTPAGDIYDLQADATPLDFAYHIHSEIGNRCRGAKVNGALVQLTHKLTTGDQVEILTTKQGRPSRDWLNPALGYLNTKHARDKVRHFFRKQNYQENLTAGQALWDKTYRHQKIPKTKLTKLAKQFNFKKSDDVLAALGAGDISIAAINHQLKSMEPTEPTPPPAAREIISKTITPTPAAKTTSLSIEGVDNLLTQLARCCKPIPGDEIIGYITKGRGISIHQESCRNIRNAIAQRPERIIEVNWGSEAPQAYPVDIIIEASDRPGLIRDISGVIAGENITLLGLTTRVNKIENIAFIDLTIEIKSLEPLNKVLKQLQQVNGVTRIQRR